MNKKLFALAALLLCSFSLFMSSCTDTEDNTVDEEWKAYNETIVKETAAKLTADGKKEYKERQSLTKNGFMYWKDTDFFDLEDAKYNKTSVSTKITSTETPYVTDSVIVRYEGWYLLKDGTKYTFDSTEGDNNSQVGRQFTLSSLAQGGVMAWVDMLLYMHEGDAVEVCIPYGLGYGASGYYTSTGVQTIPGYTTLWFRIKLLKILADNEGEFSKEK
ncbi:MAG: FKBP-type peptidyl-prolyl cis-trans isomerase [Dysgonomonas sp.]